MAHQAPQDAHVELEGILKRPRLALRLAVIASEWVSVEIALTFLYGTLLGKYLPHNQRKGPPIHSAAFQIFDSVESVNRRTELIQKLAETLITRKTIIKELKETLIPLVKKACTRRNTFIHAYWGTNDKYPDALFLIRKPGDFMIYEESDFTEAIDLIIAADHAIAKFEDEVRKHLRWKKSPR